MAYGYRCEAGCASWPDEERYKTCPVCDEPTVRFRNLQEVLTPSEAKARHFEAYYADREPDLTLTPEEVRLAEASRRTGLDEYRARRGPVSPRRIDGPASGGTEALALSA